MYSKVREPMTASKRAAAEAAKIKKLAIRAARVARAQLGETASDEAVTRLGYSLMKNQTKLASLEACMGDGMDDVPMDDMGDMDSVPPLGVPTDGMDLDGLDEPVDMDLDSDQVQDFDMDQDDTLSVDDGIYAGAITNLDKSVQAMSRKLSASVQSMTQRLAAVETALRTQRKAHSVVASSALALFGSLDRNQDGKVLASEWKGSKLVFASLDRNEDGVISAKDFMAGLGLPLTPAEQTLAGRVAEETETETEETIESDKEAGEDGPPAFIQEKIDEKEEKEESKEAARTAAKKKQVADKKVADKKPQAGKKPAAKPKKAAEESEMDEDKDEKPAGASGMPTGSSLLAEESEEVEEDEETVDETDSQAGTLFAEEDSDDTDETASALFFDKPVAPLSAADQATVDSVFGGGSVQLNPQPRKASNGPKTLGPTIARQASTKNPARGKFNPADMPISALEALWSK